jgi:hypothetical protein
MEGNRISKRVLYMNLETTRLRGRPRSRWQDEVREDGRIVGGEERQKKVHNKRGMEEDAESGKESSQSAHGSGMNERTGHISKTKIDTQNPNNRQTVDVCTRNLNTNKDRQKEIESF